MPTEMLKVDGETGYADAIRKAISVLEDGGLVAFPTEIAKALSSLVEPHSEKVAIVGLRRNEYRDELAQFDGSSFEVEFTLRRLGVHMRTAAVVDTKVLGFVSTEPPVRRGVYVANLTRKGQVVYAARHAA